MDVLPFFYFIDLQNSFAIFYLDIFISYYCIYRFRQRGTCHYLNALAYLINVNRIIPRSLGGFYIKGFYSLFKVGIIYGYAVHTHAVKRRQIAVGLYSFG